MLGLTLLAFGTALSGPVSDGERFVAIQRTPQTIEIRDDANHLKRTLNLPCRPLSISRAGVLLAQCSRDGWDPADYTTVDLAGGKWEHFRAAPLNDRDVEAFSWITRAGREWAEEHFAGHSDAGGIYFRDLQTGEYRQLTDSASTPDLDSPSLLVPLCAPLRLFGPEVLDGPGDRDRFAPYDGYDGTVAALNAYDSKAETNYELLWRCGDKQPQRLRDAAGLTVGGGWATWDTRKAAYAQRIKDRRRFKVSGKLEGIVHTKRAVYGTRDGKVFRARLKLAR